MVQLTPVESSNVAAIGYDDATQTLVAKFKNGRTYHYIGVPRDKFEQLGIAESVGRYLNEHIKGVYDYRQADG